MSDGSADGTDRKEWYIHRWECPNCGAVTRADRSVGCYRCGYEMDHVEQVATIEVDDVV